MSTGSSSFCVYSAMRAGVVYEVAADNGRVLSKIRTDAGVATRGIGRRCCGRFVAIYVSPEDETVLTLQVGKRRFRVDGRTDVNHRTSLGGTISRLTISRPDEEPVELRQTNIGGTLQRLFDSAYDDLEAEIDDFLGEIADFVYNRERRKWAHEGWTSSRGS